MSTQPQHAELLRELEEIESDLRALKDKAGIKPRPFGLDDAERERMRESIEALSDVDLVSMLMTLHKVVERDATGRHREHCEIETIALTAALGRFAPEPFADALAVWSEHSEDGDDA